MFSESDLYCSFLDSIILAGSKRQVLHGSNKARKYLIGGRTYAVNGQAEVTRRQVQISLRELTSANGLMQS